MIGGGLAAAFNLYAVSMVGIGVLSHTGNNVAMDSYGPISDYANGIGEMAWHGMEGEETPKARQIMSDLDAVGNTTTAITKGIAIALILIAVSRAFLHHNHSQDSTLPRKAQEIPQI